MTPRPTVVVVITLAAWLAATLAARGQEPEIVDGWTVAPPDYDQSKIVELDEAVAAERFKDVNSVIVVRNGELLIERYYNGASREQTHDPRSVGKTVAATLLGIAISEGYIQSVDQRLGDFYDLEAYDNYSEKKEAVTLRHLLTMTSGFDGYDFESESIGNEEFMYPQDDWVRWALDLPMAEDREPGDAWRYFTAGVVILGDILNSAVPGGLEAYADLKLFAPIGVRNYQWQHTPQRVANTAGGIQLTPLGFAKFGELHRNYGHWRGRSVVAADWVDAMLAPVVDTTVEGNRYGYLWWHKSYTVGDDAWDVAYCSGNGGNKIFVFDDRDLVVVVTASAYGQRYMHSQVDEIMEEFVLPAVREDFRASAGDQVSKWRRAPRPAPASPSLRVRDPGK